MTDFSNIKKEELIWGEKLLKEWDWKKMVFFIRKL